MKSKSNPFLRRSLVLAGALSFTVSAAFADTISPSVDLRVLSTNPDVNDTGALSLYNEGGSNTQRTFLQFNLGSYSGNSITTDATLTLTAGIFGDSLTGVSIGTANSAWTQGGATPITWNNQPGITPIAGATNPSGTFGTGPVTWTIPWYILEKMATAVIGYDNGLGITSGVGSTQHFESTGSGTAPTLAFSAATGAGSTWTGGNGNWTDTANWAGGTVAEGIDQAATINGGTAVDITMDANRSVGSLSFSGADHTISSGAGKLALNVVSGAPTVSVEATRTATISAELVGLDGLTKTDSGKLVLSGTNTYTGATTVSGGTLALQSAYASSGFAISTGASLELNVDSGSRDLGITTFTGTGTLAKTGAGNVIWAASSATFALGAGSLIDVQQGSFVGGSNANENWSGNLSGLNVASSAVFNGVEANVRVDALTGAGTITSGFPGAGYLNFTFGVNGGSGTFDGTLTDSDTAAANFVKEGAGTQALTGSNTYTGTTTVSGGTLSLGNGTTNTNLADAATVSIASGTTVNLNFTGTDAVGKLIIDGETVPGGVYDGSLSTPLPYRDYFTGTGSLTVLVQSGTWTSTVDGNWSNSANWLSNLIATGTDNTATFSAGTGSETIIVTLDSNRGIGNLAFSNANYTITGNTLTLDSSTLSTLSVASGNTATISSALAGTPDVDKTGDGTLTLSGGLSYSGTTTVSAGILELQDLIGGGGSNYNGSNISINGASTLRVSGLRYNFNGKTFTFDSTGGGTIDAIASGAGGLVFMGNNTFFTSGGAQNIISGTKNVFGNEGFNLNGSSAIFEVETGSDATSDLKVIGTIWNNGNVTKNGGGRMEISAPQGYTGTTTVIGGSLILGDGTNNIGLSDSEDVVVESGATLQLNYLVGNSDSIDELSLGGVLQSPGVYGAATYSGVTITGTGTLTVLNGPITDPFLAWIDTFFPGETDPLIIGATADPDNDGIENLVEYVLKNGDPDASSTGILPTLDASGANLVFTYLRRTDATGTTQTFQYGNNLSGWTDVPVIDGGIVSITSPEAGIEQVVITVAKGVETKLFGRLQVVK